MPKYVSLLTGIILSGYNLFSQQIIPLPISDTETTTRLLIYPEESIYSQTLKGTIIRNVQTPQLIAYRPAPRTENGTALIICPGGAFRILAMSHEGEALAKKMTEQGYTAFVLKYRLAPTNEWPGKKLISDLVAKKFDAIDSVNAPFVPLAIADGREAIHYVRQHAEEFAIEPNRIVMMGFSAGGAVAASVAMSPSVEDRPNYVALIYPYYRAIPNDPLPSGLPPLFQALAADDFVTDGDIDLYKNWLRSGGSAETHIYSKGGHGFGVNIQNLPSDHWMDDFAQWLLYEKLSYSPRTFKVYPFEFIYQFIQNARRRAKDDWAYQKRYELENQLVSSSGKKEIRVVFMGNSITEGWVKADSAFFQKNPYINRGIGGQTTSQMLLRFRQDVINLKPKAVVILGGTNDIAGATGPITLEAIMGNLASMAELATAAGIKVILCSVLPVSDYPIRPGLQPAKKIIALNKMIKAYAQKNNYPYVDYWTPLAGNDLGLRKELTTDGVHPTAEGYKIMKLEVEKTLSKSLLK